MKYLAHISCKGERLFAVNAAVVEHDDTMIAVIAVVRAVHALFELQADGCHLRRLPRFYR